MKLKNINCPCCNNKSYQPWAIELNYQVVRCVSCKLLYVNPMPDSDDVDAAVRNGEHLVDAQKLNVRSRRIPKKISAYKVLESQFSDLWRSKRKIIWVDVGCGYGETLEAVQMLAATGSTVLGVEPMAHKAKSAQSRGLQIVNSYLQPNQFKADVISAVDIFSHIPDFHSFLEIVATNLIAGGEVFIETGNLADIMSRSEFPGELGLPDHLVFAGVKQITKYLNASGFDVVDIREQRVDTLLNTIKNVVKKMIGRQGYIKMPYTSKYRQIRIRAKLRNTA
jgi:2-polyprenyl-3-methyl-5-hydroxy-6-metoxy-1,4-benzoquinol methylase